MRHQPIKAAETLGWPPKGEELPRELLLFGVDQFQGPSRRGDFRYSRPGTGGDCGSNNYRLGHLYLLFLGDLQFPAGSGRTNEEMEDDEDPWLQAVLRYLEVTVLDDPELESDALAELRIRAQSQEDPDYYPPGLVADIDRHFDLPNRFWSFDQLAARFSQHRDRFLAAPGHSSGSWDNEQWMDSLTAEGILTLLSDSGEPGVESFFKEMLSFESWVPEYPVARFFALHMSKENQEFLASLVLRDVHRGTALAALFKAGIEVFPIMIGALEDARPSEVASLGDWFCAQMEISDTQRGQTREAIRSYRNEIENEEEGERLDNILTCLGDETRLSWAVSRFATETLLQEATGPLLDATKGTIERLSYLARGTAAVRESVKEAVRAAQLLLSSPLPPAHRVIADLTENSFFTNIFIDSLVDGHPLQPAALEIVISAANRAPATQARLVDALQKRCRSQSKSSPACVALGRLTGGRG